MANFPEQYEKRGSANQILVGLTVSDIVTIGNALNQVLHTIDDFEFHAVMGADKETVESLRRDFTKYIAWRNAIIND